MSDTAKQIAELADLKARLKTLDINDELRALSKRVKELEAGKSDNSTRIFKSSEIAQMTKDGTFGEYKKDLEKAMVEGRIVKDTHLNDNQGKFA